jgi:hypothetical protein
MIDLAATFEKFEDEWEFEKVDQALTRRSDLYAFCLLDKLVPGVGDIVDHAEHDEIWLSIDCEELARVASEDHILSLVRCGVRYDDDEEALKMFV